MRCLSVNGLGFTFGDMTVIDNVSFEAKPGEIVSFVGPSGCGKSTLLRCIAGLLKVPAGTIRLGDAGSPEQHQGCAFVFQAATLLPWLTVEENLTLPFRLRDEYVPWQEIMAWLRLLGLNDFTNHFPNALSVGMAQRVAFVRALSEGRRILLLDEPYSGLDELTRRTLSIFLSRTVSERQITTIFVTHSIHDAVFLGSRVMVLSDRPAAVLDEIEVDIPRPRGAELWLTGALMPYIDRARRVLETGR